MTYGVQLYSVRDAVKELGMRETLRRVAEIGYKSVELAGMGDLTARELLDALNENGLSVDGAHIGIKDLSPERLEATMADMKTIGNRRIIIPAAKVNNRENMDILLEKLAYAAPILQKEGFSIGFHNHAVEFEPNEDGIVPLRELEARTELFWELDTYWAFHAGVDPLAEMERMGDRLHLIHLKDGIPALGNASGRPLGMGEAPVEAVWRKALQMQLPIVVESETLTPDGLTEIRQCFDFLRALEAK